MEVSLVNGKLIEVGVGNMMTADRWPDTALKKQSFAGGLDAFASSKEVFKIKQMNKISSTAIGTFSGIDNLYGSRRNTGGHYRTLSNTGGWYSTLSYPGSGYGSWMNLGDSSRIPSNSGNCIRRLANLSTVAIKKHGKRR